MRTRFQSSLSIAIFLITPLVSAGASAAEAFLPALMVQSVDVSDIPEFTRLMQQANTQMQEEHNVPLFLRAYQAHSLGNDGAVFVLSPSGTFGGVVENNRLYSEDDKLAALRKQMAALADFGPATYVKAVRFDGTNTPGWLNNFYVHSNNESLLLDTLAAFEGRLPADETISPLINVFRVVAGQGGFTHLVSFNTLDEQAMSSLLDVMANQEWEAGFPVSVDADTRVLENRIYYELGQ